MSFNTDFENHPSDSKKINKHVEAIQISIADLEPLEEAVTPGEEANLTEIPLPRSSSEQKSKLQIEAEAKEHEEMKGMLREIYAALCEKGYDPARQIAGYILSEDPVYITNWKNARGLIGHINRDDLLVALIRHYLNSLDQK